jgi:hypothetical protein
MLIRYNKCVFCKSNNLKICANQKYNYNFYVKYISKDLNLNKKYLEKIKTYRCKVCNLYQNNPWFDGSTTKKIYSNIYGQHHRSWLNIINYFNKGIMPDHGELFKILIKKIKVKKYAEFNSVFMGFFINFFENENQQNLKEKKLFFENALNYLKSRQLAGFSPSKRKSFFLKSVKFLKSIKIFKDKNRKKKLIKKFLLTDNSFMSWGENDNHKSVNSKTLASELFDLNFININNMNKMKKSFDLIGIFHSLDHTFEPKKILDLSLSISDYVLVYSHSDKKINKQHLFSFNEQFLDYLNKEKIYTINLTDKIGKKYKSPELYFLCSKSKKKISRFNENKY